MRKGQMYGCLSVIQSHSSFKVSNINNHKGLEYLEQVFESPMLHLGILVFWAVTRVPFGLSFKQSFKLRDAIYDSPLLFHISSVSMIEVFSAGNISMSHLLFNKLYIYSVIE